MSTSRAIIVISKREWEKFMASVEELVESHSELLKLVRDLKSRNATMKEQLRDALASGTRQIARRITSRREETMLAPKPPAPEEELDRSVGSGSLQSLVYACTNCGRELLLNSKFCDRCGRQLTWP